MVVCLIDTKLTSKQIIMGSSKNCLPKRFWNNNFSYNTSVTKHWYVRRHPFMHEHAVLQKETNGQFANFVPWHNDIKKWWKRQVVPVLNNKLLPWHATFRTPAFNMRTIWSCRSNNWLRNRRSCWRSYQLNLRYRCHQLKPVAVWLQLSVRLRSKHATLTFPLCQSIFFGKDSCIRHHFNFLFVNICDFSANF